MKLYFYHLSQPLGEKPRIEVEECRVEEKSKTYRRMDKFPEFYCGHYVKKEDIRKLAGYNFNVVVLTERDDAKVAEIFKEKLHYNIGQYQYRIENLKKEIAKAYDLIDMVDDWRLENETH